jgi:hypothetical protein
MAEDNPERNRVTSADASLTGKTTEENPMNMKEIQHIAKERDLAPGRMTKVELVRTLQREEGNQDCFQTGLACSCGQAACLWREDCE